MNGSFNKYMDTQIFGEAGFGYFSNLHHFVAPGQSSCIYGGNCFSCCLILPPRAS